ncbi:hydroxymethylglutaryl-CoA synthase [Malassezia yamatoensis]|uniref:Hydroxymethylglutaryl-CoA synthase n=1 Tax=Malassezia yamatoensis TaxID=253288 RepID=A0AAJ6CI19_9BASI|nr:hydroxymethylglutaryl-CoA synthase [Malassezia yamatoensis]
MANAWDFYKPDLTSEYPTVDGPLTLQTYLGSVDLAYDAFRNKYNKLAEAKHLKLNKSTTSDDSRAHFGLDDVDFVAMHSPYAKLVQKGFARLVCMIRISPKLYNDYLADPSNEKYAEVPKEYGDLDRQSTITNKDVEKHFAALSKSAMFTKLEPGMDTVRRCGNMYTGSLYGGLASIIANKTSEELQNKRILLYSFGSGCAASFFIVRVAGSTDTIREKLQLKQRLASMQVVPCTAYVDALNTREETHNSIAHNPKGSLDDLWPNSYYLEKVDDKFRRFYQRTSS